jgi:hypothetical protein
MGSEYLVPSIQERFLICVFSVLIAAFVGIFVCFLC